MGDAAAGWTGPARAAGRVPSRRQRSTARRTARAAIRTDARTAPLVWVPVLPSRLPPHHPAGGGV